MSLRNRMWAQNVKSIFNASSIFSCALSHASHCTYKVINLFSQQSENSRRSSQSCSKHEWLETIIDLSIIAGLERIQSKMYAMLLNDLFSSCLLQLSICIRIARRNASRTIRWPLSTRMADGRNRITIAVAAIYGCLRIRCRSLATRMAAIISSKWQIQKQKQQQQQHHKVKNNCSTKSS